MVKAELHRVLEKIVSDLGATVSFAVDYPPSNVSGGADYATNAALAAAKALGKNPQEVAESIKVELEKMALPFVQEVTIAGPGFVNITLTSQFFRDAVARTLSEGEEWGKNALREGMRVMVEHTQPNPFKPFHIGHLMSNTIGESVTRLMRYSGAQVIAANYQGDVGLHIAKAIWGLQQKGYDASDVTKIGEAYVSGNSAYEEDAKAKEEIVSINKRIYARDPELMPLYNQGREVTLARFEVLYRLLGTRFDHYFFESETALPGMELVKEGKEKGVFEESEGAVVFRGEKAGLHTRVFITKEGLPTYETKDLGLAVSKLKLFPLDLSITTTAIEQGEYFKVVFEALAEMRPEFRGKFLHVAFGMLQLTSGKMSSRKGNIITGESLIEDMTEAARLRMKEGDRDVGEDVAGIVGVAAIKYTVLKQNLGKNIVFDPEKSLSLEGDSGPYLQYAHVRTSSILRKAKEENVIADTHGPHGETTQLEKLLIRFPEVVERASQDIEPHHVAQYLTELSSALNSWYASTKVLDGTDQAPYKLAIVDATRQTLKNGLYLLGISAPEEM